MWRYIISTIVRQADNESLLYLRGINKTFKRLVDKRIDDISESYFTEHALCKLNITGLSIPIVYYVVPALKKKSVTERVKYIINLISGQVMDAVDFYMINDSHNISFSSSLFLVVTFVKDNVIIHLQ